MDGSVQLASLRWNAAGRLLAFLIDTAIPDVFELYVKPVAGGTDRDPFRLHAPLAAGDAILSASFRP
jgi:hypothetical protein